MIHKEVMRLHEMMHSTGASKMIDKVRDWPWSDDRECDCMVEQMIAIKLGLGESAL